MHDSNFLPITPSVPFQIGHPIIRLGSHAVGFREKDRTVPRVLITGSAGWNKTHPGSSDSIDSRLKCSCILLHLPEGSVISFIFSVTFMNWGRGWPRKGYEPNYDKVKKQGVCAEASHPDGWHAWFTHQSWPGQASSWNKFCNIKPAPWNGVWE